MGKKHLIDAWHDMEMNFNPQTNLFNNSDILVGSVGENQALPHEFSEHIGKTNGKVACSEPVDIPRKSVICSIQDADCDVNKSDCEDSSCGSSMVLEGDTETSDDSSSKLNTFQPQSEPTADPSQIECVLTDTSADEGSDSEDENHLSSTQEFISKRHSRHTSCFMCACVVVDNEGSNEFVKHLQSIHKFAVHKFVDNTVTNQQKKYEGSIVIEPKEGFSCHKSNGGCGTVFFSKQALVSHHVRSRTAGSSCWLASQRSGQAKPLFCCTLCTHQTPSRKGMLGHMETKHNCPKNFDKAVNDLKLSCRVCQNRFWTLAERCEHEVNEHSSDISDLILKCHLCLEKFSSKVCLKKHTRRYHASEEQFTGGVGFRCRLCSVTYPSHILIEEHFRIFHKSFLVFQCHKCGLLLKTRKTYQVHLKSTECGIHQECSLCKKVVWSKRALAIHFRMKHFNSTHVGFLCRICKQRFNSKIERAQHYSVDHKGDSPFKCPICNKGFSSKSGMYGHRQTHSKNSLSKCNVCGKEFTRKDSYYEHLLIHNGPRHKCSYCDKEFVQRSNLVRHIRIHTGEKPYKCSHCEKTFSDKGACNAHIRVHTRADACSCPYCGQVFSKKQKLKYHLRKHTGQDLVSCEICGKNFTNSHSLKEHRVIHDHSTQMLCTYCGKAFSSAKYLHRHIAMSHEAVLLFKCPLCFRGFPQQARLKTHLMTHSKVKHLRCLLCSKAYSAHKSLRSHLLSSHDITSNHPDYKQCFYSMTPEEAGVQIKEVQRVAKQASRQSVHISDIQAMAKQGLLSPKPEPVSSDGESEENSDQEEEDCNESVVHQESVPAAMMLPSPFPMKTKAAMKQLPFNVHVEEKKGSKSIKGSHCSFRKKQDPSSCTQLSVPSKKLPKPINVKKSKSKDV